MLRLKSVGCLIRTQIGGRLTEDSGSLTDTPNILTIIMNTNGFGIFFYQVNLDEILAVMSGNTYIIINKWFIHQSTMHKGSISTNKLYNHEASSFFTSVCTWRIWAIPLSKTIELARNIFIVVVHKSFWLAISFKLCMNVFPTFSGLMPTPSFPFASISRLSSSPDLFW